MSNLEQDRIHHGRIGVESSVWRMRIKRWCLLAGLCQRRALLFCSYYSQIDEHIACRRITKRLHFFTLCDSSGAAQLVVNEPICGKETLAAMRTYSEQSVVSVTGRVVVRPENQRRPVRSGISLPRNEAHNEL